jgi:hypothetical protein
MPVNKDVLPRKRPAKPLLKGMISENDLKILWVSRTLTNIDFQYGEDLLSLERSNIEIEQKSYIRKQLMLKHQERREPYRKLLENLMGLAAPSDR